MSGLQPESNKKHPLLGGTSKPKTKETTYVFNLTIGESNEETYPEYSWKDLVSHEKAKKSNKDRVASGKTVLDPYASDDEDNLKALAASFEAKYANPANPQKKRKRRAEDYIDRGAGYDESDSFIDNSDAYDEVVPADLETFRGGFYINSGSLDFKEVDISDDEGGGGPSNAVESKENGKSHVNSSTNINNIHSGTTKTNGKKSSLNLSTKKNHHHHHQTLSSKNSISKSEKLKGSNKLGGGPVSSSSNTVPSSNTANSSNVVKNTAATAANDIEDISNKKSPSNKSESSSSGSSSSGSSSSGDSSSSSDSSSSEDEEEDEEQIGQKTKIQIKQSKQQLEQGISITPTTMPPSASSSSSLNINPNLNTSTGPPPIKRLKTKNVPPNPNLVKNKILNSSNNNNNNNNYNVTSASGGGGNNNNPNMNSSLKLSSTIHQTNNLPSTKDMIVSNLSPMPNTKLSSSSSSSSISLVSPSSRPTQSHSPSTTLGINMPPGLTASNIKVPTPKSTPTSGSSNSGLNLKSMTLPKPQKPKEMKQKLNKSARNSMSNHQHELNLLHLAATVAAQNKKKAKLNTQGDKQGLKTLSSANLSRQQHLNQQHQPSLNRPPKLKAKPNPLLQQQQQLLSSPLSLSSTSLNLKNVSSSVNLNQSLPSTFSSTSNRSSLSQPSQQQQSLSSSQITKIKPGHLTSTSSSPSSSTAHNLSINSSIKSLSNLGTGITVTEVKEKGSNASHSQHSLPSSSVTKEGPRSRSPNVGNTAMSHNSSRGLPQSITITPSSLLNLSTTGSSSSNLMSTPISTSNSALNLSNMINMNSISNLSRGNFFGQTNNPLNTSSSNTVVSNVKKSSSGGFSMNTILGTSLPNNNSSSLFTDSGLMSINKLSAFNIGRDSNKKTS